MKRLFFFIIAFAFFSIQNGFSNEKLPLHKKFEKFNTLLPKTLHVKVDNTNVLKKVKLCNEIIVRGITPCASGSSGPGNVTFTSVTYNSNENGDCGGPTISNLVYAQTETLSYCTPNPE